MNEQRTKFEQAASKADWGQAFRNLNGLNMSEMLDSLSKLPTPTLDNLIQRRFAFKTGVNMPRMEYAWTVIKSRQLPLIAPGDLLQQGQVATAAQFVKKPLVRPKVALRLIVFRDVIVTNRALFEELKQRAEQIFTAQGNGFSLNVFVHPNDIHFQERIFLQTQLAEMITLAKKQTTIPSDRLIVLLVRLKSGIEFHGVAPVINGQHIVVVDTDTPNPDRATLLHEIGHCAGLPHAGEPPAGRQAPVDVGDSTNVMAESKTGVTRDKLTVTQGEFLAKAFFAKK